MKQIISKKHEKNVESISFNPQERRIKSSNKFYWMDNLFRAIDKQNKLTPGFKDGYLKTMREQVSKNRIKREQMERISKFLKGE